MFHRSLQLPTGQLFYAAPIYPTIDSLIDPLIDLPTYCLMTNFTCNNCYYLKLQTIIKVSNKIDNQLNVIIYNISNILVSSQISKRVPVMEEQQHLDTSCRMQSLEFKHHSCRCSTMTHIMSGIIYRFSVPLIYIFKNDFFCIVTESLHHVCQYAVFNKSETGSNRARWWNTTTINCWNREPSTNNYCW